jgi:hypothetical protein
MVARQPNSACSSAPTSGAIIGATVMPIMTKPILLAAWSRGKTSRIMARVITMPAQAPPAWMARATTSRPMDGASAAARDATQIDAQPGQQQRPPPETVR